MRSTLRVLLLLPLLFPGNPATATPPTDIMGTIPLTATDYAAAPATSWPELLKALREGPAALEELFAGLRADLARGDPRGNDLAMAYGFLRVFQDRTAGIGGVGSAVADARAWFEAAGDSLTKQIVRASLPVVGCEAPSKEARYAALVAQLAGDLGQRAEHEHDPEFIVAVMRAARDAGRPDDEVETLLRRVVALAPRYPSAGSTFLASSLSSPPAGLALARLERLAALAPGLAPAITTDLALEVLQDEPNGSNHLRLALAQRLPHDVIRTNLRSRKPGLPHGYRPCLAWLRLAAMVDDQELAAAAARRLTLFHGPSATESPSYLPALLAWARGQGPRSDPARAPLLLAAKHRETPTTMLVFSRDYRAAYAPSPLAVDAVLPPRPTDPYEAWRYDRYVAGYATHGAHDPALDARVIDFLDHFAQNTGVGLTDRRLWLAMRDDARTLMAAGCKDPLVRHAAAYLACVAGDDTERVASLAELLASALDLARSPYHPACAFWAMDERRWMGTFLGATETSGPFNESPTVSRLALMVTLLERILMDPRVPDFAALDAARRAIEAEAVDAPDVVAIARAGRPTEAVALALEGRALLDSVRSAWGSRDVRDLAPAERQALAEGLATADRKLEQALAISPSMRDAALDAILLSRSRFDPPSEVLRRIERARRISPRHVSTAGEFYSYLLSSPRRTDIPDRVEQILSALDAMLAERSSWDASAVLSLVTTAHMLVAREDMWATWKPEFTTQPEGELLKLHGRFTEPRRAAQIRSAIAHTLAITDGTLRSKRDHGHAAQLLYMLGDEKEALRHFIAAGRTMSHDEPGAVWVHNELWKRLPPSGGPLPAAGR